MLNRLIMDDLNTETPEMNDSYSMTKFSISTIISETTSAIPVQDTGKLFRERTWTYVGPVVFFIGLFGNCLSFIVMRRQAFRKSTMSVYLPVLAVADSMALITGMITEWLETAGILLFSELDPWACVWEKFLFYTSADWAIFVLVAFTLDRFVAVCFPLRKSNICTKRRASIYCAVLLVLVIGKNLEVFWTRGSKYEEMDNGELILVTNCGYAAGYEYYSTFVRPWIAFAVVSVLPFICILVFNIGIIRTLIKKGHHLEKSSSNHPKSYSQTNIMCISVSVVFLLTQTPSFILLIGKPYWYSRRTEDGYEIAKGFFNVFVYLNHSLNFFLYCLSGKRFRSELTNTLRCIPSKLSAYQREGFSSTQNTNRQTAGSKANHISSGALSIISSSAVTIVTHPNPQTNNRTISNEQSIHQNV